MRVRFQYHIPKLGNFPLSLEGVGDINGLDDKLSILEFSLSALILVVRDDVLLSVLHFGAIHTERVGETGVAGFHC